VVKGPPTPFDPAIGKLPAGHLLYRVFTATRTPTEFNPGIGASTRFGFFGAPGQPKVPIMYAAETEEAAIAETLLHNVPPDGGELAYDRYSPKALARLEVTRELRLAVLHGMGLRRLKVTAGDVTSSPASTYPDTVRWAEAAHGIGADGMVWMSRLCNSAKAYVFFGDRCGGTKGAFAQDPSHARIFASAADQMWLIDLCAPLHVDVLLKPL
jgi:hypothetical protein